MNFSASRKASNINPSLRMNENNKYEKLLLSYNARRFPFLLKGQTQSTHWLILAVQQQTSLMSIRILIVTCLFEASLWGIMELTNNPEWSEPMLPLLITQIVLCVILLGVTSAPPLSNINQIQVPISLLIIAAMTERSVANHYNSIYSELSCMTQLALIIMAAKRSTFKAKRIIQITLIYKELRYIVYLIMSSPKSYERVVSSLILTIGILIWLHVEQKYKLSKIPLQETLYERTPIPMQISEQKNTMTPNFRQRGILDQIPLGMIVLSNDFHIVYQNRKALHYLGISLQELPDIESILAEKLQNAKDLSQQRDSKRYLSNLSQPPMPLRNNTMCQILEERKELSGFEQQKQDGHHNQIRAFSLRQLGQLNIGSVASLSYQRLRNKSNQLQNILKTIPFDEIEKETKLRRLDNSFTSQKSDKSSFKMRVENLNKQLLLRFQSIKVGFKDYKIIIIESATNQVKLENQKSLYKFYSLLFNSFSHELRTPLNCSLQMLQCLHHEMSNQELIHSYLNPAIISNKLLLHQINDILDYAAFEAEYFQLKKGFFKIKDVFDIIYEYYSSICQKKQITLTCNIEENLKDLQIESDIERIQQIVVNLINNSLKYTPSGGEIQITATQKIRVPPTQENNLPIEKYFIKFTVADNGRGISVDRLNAIQQILSCTSDSVNLLEVINQYEQQYVGLGFKVSNRIAQELSHDIYNSFKIKSKENVGTRVSFHIQVEQFSHTYINQMFNTQFQQSPNTEVQRSAIYFKPLKGSEEQITVACPCPKMLICDDIPFNQMALQALLKTFGYKADVAGDGYQALEAIKARYQGTCGPKCSKQYQLVFMDIEMPGKNGYETCKDIKKQPLGKETNVIMCSAYDSKENQDSAYESGMVDIISKPVDRRCLKTILERYVK